MSEIKDILKAAVSLPFEPVVGGNVNRLLFALCGLGVIGIGIYNIVIAITTDWTVPFAKIETEYADSLPYPDFYLCIPAVFADSYRAGRSTYMVLNAFGRESLGTTCSSPTDGSMPTRVSLESLKLAGKLPGNSDNATCAYRGVAAPHQGDVNIHFGCEASESATGCISPNETSPMTRRVEMLLGQMSNYTDDNGTPTNYADDRSTPPLCVGYESTGLGQSRTDMTDYQIFLEMSLSAPDTNQPFFLAYLMEAGKDPVVNGQIVATPIKFSGTGLVTGAQLQMERVKDETRGETEYTQEFRYNLWSKPMFTCKQGAPNSAADCPDDGSDGTQPYTYTTDFYKAYIGFWYSSFVVRKITIRRKTFSEIYSELGGIWAASVALLGYVFVKSGKIDGASKKEAYVFKYLPTATRLQWLDELDGRSKGSSTEMKSAAAPVITKDSV